MKYYYSYEVKIIREDTEAYAEDIFTGVTYGDTYHEALDNILDFYGIVNVISVTLEPWDAEGCLEISKEALREIVEAL